MVRCGTLPLRLLCKKYGADIVYGEEIIDRKISRCLRRENVTLGCIDYVDKDDTFGTEYGGAGGGEGESGGAGGKVGAGARRKKDGKRPNVVFRTLPEQEGPVVFQIGTGDAVNALKGAEVVARDVSAIDVNMGCPKHFSISGGMGAALLQKPDTVVDILKTLIRNLSVPITCKVRLLETTEKTLDFMRICANTGISAIALHGRYKEQRSSTPARLADVKAIADAGLSIPLIHNGDVFKYEDIGRLREATGADAVMIARGAMWNPSVFSPTMRPKMEVAKEYLKTALHVDNFAQNTKYTLLRMLEGDEDMEVRHAIQRVKGHEALCEALNLAEYYRLQQATRAAGDKRSYIGLPPTLRPNVDPY